MRIGEKIGENMVISHWKMREDADSTKMWIRG